MTSLIPKKILVTGATGYIGGRLVPRLLAEGHHVVCLSRSKKKVMDRTFAEHPHVSVVEGDAGKSADLIAAMQGVHVAYYLVHSMIAAPKDYASEDARLAKLFAECAEQSGVDRIIYLAGLGETQDDLSDHLKSRREVEHALASGTVPVTVLRAAMIIGSGSASFEILRYLVERLPIMITPKWVQTECQPIAIRDVLRYLVQCLTTEDTRGRTMDVGGTEVVTYRKLMDITAEALELRKRIVVPVPVLTPRLSSLWIHLVTPMDRRVALPLAEGLKNRVVCRDDTAKRLMPGPLFSPREAIALSVARHHVDQVESSWSDAGVIPGDPDWAGGKVFVDERCVESSATAAALYAAICRVGGGHGWYAGDILWRIRGWIDKLCGGPGLRRGRRHREQVRFGDALDFWRVTDVVKDQRLSLRAEMKLPGVATLTFQIEEAEGKNRVLRQTARFKPKGLAGLAYWYAVLPFHSLVFRGMLAGIQRAAETPKVGAAS
jgi:uncharacterized protein YbjT (DUF2867 family)